MRKVLGIGFQIDKDRQIASRSLITIIIINPIIAQYLIAVKLLKSYIIIINLYLN